MDTLLSACRRSILFLLCRLQNIIPQQSAMHDKAHWKISGRPFFVQNMLLSGALSIQKGDFRHPFKIGVPRTDHHFVKADLWCMRPLKWVPFFRNLMVYGPQRLFHLPHNTILFVNFLLALFLREVHLDRCNNTNCVLEYHNLLSLSPLYRISAICLQKHTLVNI